MRTPAIHCLAAAVMLALGLSAAPISHTGNGISLGYSQAKADETAKKKDKVAAAKSCTKDQPCNDAKAKAPTAKKAGAGKVVEKSKDKPMSKVAAVAKDKPKEKVAAKTKAEPKEIANANGKDKPKLKHSDD